MADTPPARLFTFDNTLGASVIGFAASCVVFGVLMTQVWTYFRRYNSDSVLYKLLVVLILLLQTVDQAFIGHFVYFYTVTSAGNPTELLTGSTTWSIILQQAIGSVVGTIVKCCFATRVYRFSEKNIFITGFIVLLALGQLGVALVFTVKAFQLSSIPAVFNLKTLATISLGLGVFTDVVTAAALWFFLRRLRTGYRAADSLVRSLVTDAVNTGVLTSAVSLATLLLFNLLPGNLIFGATYFLLSKLYAVSFLATLNTRRVVRGRGTDHEKETSSVRRATTREQQETNMFHLGTRMPTLHEHEPEAYPEFDIKPGFPPQPSSDYSSRYAI
ncbi:hypothetical protein B0H17DRAFT_1196228 [Mycena rosella]|uniref:DUF6534 domain-containing protein n=1 Tax=Mycena rosella TaxID=1033263 RepID=A0AAD7DW04_MYCRO|nr:hypothetical protein B0H17DRAFT_1196228 [Mycena rosella]